MKRTETQIANEIRYNEYNDNFEIKNERVADEVREFESGGDQLPTRAERARKVAYIQRERKRKAKKQRIIAAVITASIAIAAATSFCVFGLPMINGSANNAAPKTTISAQATAKKDAVKTNTDTSSAAVTNNSGSEDTNYVQPYNDNNTTDNTVNNNAETYNAPDNTVISNNDTNSNTDNDVNVVQPYNSSDVSKLGDGSIGDTKTAPNDNPGANNTTNVDTNTGGDNVVQPYVGD